MTEYWRYREPYLPKFFAVMAEATEMSRAQRLLDVACGTGVVALGFAPFAGSVKGIDVDASALDIARAEARRTNIDIELVHVGIEDVTDEAPYDVVTIGRAHAYLPREATLAQLEHLVAANGRVVVCGSSVHDRLSGPWAVAYRVTGQRWGRRMPALRAKEFMAGSAFRFERRLIVRRTREISMADLLHRALSYSKLMPEAFGPRKDEYLEDIRSAVAPYAVDGMVKETIETTGNIFRRA